MDMENPGLTHCPSFGDDFISIDDRFPVSSPDYSFSFSINSTASVDDLADSVFSNGWILPRFPSTRSCAGPDLTDLGSRSVSSSDEIELDSPRNWNNKWRIRDLVFRGRRGLSDVKRKFGSLRWRKGGKSTKDMDMASVHRLLYGRAKVERRTTPLPYSQYLLSGFFGSASRRTTSFDLRVVPGSDLAVFQKGQQNRHLKMTHCIAQVVKASDMASYLFSLLTCTTDISHALSFTADFSSLSWVQFCLLRPRSFFFSNRRGFLWYIQIYSLGGEYYYSE